MCNFALNGHRDGSERRAVKLLKPVRRNRAERLGQWKTWYESKNILTPSITWRIDSGAETWRCADGSGRSRPQGARRGGHR